jgi:ABC-type branched-subunit amino acid transport system permease subunit
MGINVGFYKTLAFSISSAYAAIGGALITYSNLSFISPESFTLLDSIAYLTAIVVGGLATVPGAALGAAFITFQEEIIDWSLADEWTFAVGSHMLFAIPSPLSYIFGLIQNEWTWEPWPNPEPAGNIQDLRLPMYGLILILVMTFMPYGFWGFFKKVAGWRPWNEYGRYRESGSAGAYFDQRLRQPVLDRLGRNRGTWSAQTPVSPDPPLRPEEEP